MTTINRREAMAFGAGSLVITMLPFKVSADVETTMAAIKEFTGGADAADDGMVTLTMPEIAENGNTVPLGVSVDSPMTAENHVKRIMVLAEGNPNPGVATFRFTPMSGSAEASTRMRLAKTQNVVAVAELSDGSYHMTSTQVKVTIGGCGG